MSQQSITSNHKIILSLPDNIWQRAQTVASQRNTSLPELITQMLNELLPEEETQYQIAMNRQLRLLETPPNLGTYGKITWARDELHER
ncbi:MAG: CopG family transcriptional regulator [Anaerolineae bacterium]|nr:CopG family transcriptional regulator [Anaerolineae bacterium]